MSWKNLLKNLVVAALLAVSSPLAADSGHFNGIANAFGKPAQDHQVWFEQRFSYKICDEFQFLFGGDERWGNDYHTLWYTNMYVGLQFNATKHLICNPEESCVKNVSFAFVYSREDFIAKSNAYAIRAALPAGVTDLKWVTRNRPYIYSFISFGFCDWILNTRQQFEYDCYENSHYSNYIAWRPFFSLYTPWKWTCFKINPYVSNEAFVRGTTKLINGLYENRLRVGVAVDFSALDYGCFTDSLRTELFWMWRILRQPNSSTSVRDYTDTWVWGATIFKDF